MLKGCQCQQGMLWRSLFVRCSCYAEHVVLVIMKIGHVLACGNVDGMYYENDGRPLIRSSRAL